jgi:DNA end-binding protein Ku
MKAYWQGTLSCELLTIPVKLYAAATRHELRFHYLHASCRSPIEYVRHCPRCGTAVAGEDLVRGYEHEEALVIVSEQDLAALPQTKEPVIVVRQCVQAEAVDPMCFERAFCVEPGAGAKKAYALLCEALRQAGVVALGTATLREHDRMVLLRPAAGVLVLHTLFAPSEMLATERLALPHRPPHPAEIKAAQAWVARLSGAYVPGPWADRFQEALTALVARKAKASANRVPALPRRARRKPWSPPPKAAA